MIDKNKLDDLAKRLMFKMNDDEYETLAKEFDVTLKQMEFIGNISNIENVEPMFYPFDLELDDSCLREDIPCNEIDFNDMLNNVKEYEGSKVRVPKVVE